jgi:tetratricopeptide (TPR) repeat protein
VDVAESLNNLAGLAQADGDLAQARALYERAVRILVPLLGEDHDFTLFAMGNVANVLSDLADYAGAKTLYGRRSPASSGSSARSIRAWRSRSTTSPVYQELGAYSDALPLYERALAINRSVRRRPGNGAVAPEPSARSTSA